MKYKIYIDTNFLLIPEQFGIDIFTEIDKICDFSYELYVLEGTIKELERIAERKKVSGKDKMAAKLGLMLIKKLEKTKHLKIAREPHSKNVDDLLFSLAKASDDMIIATADAELKRQLKTVNCKLITLHKKSHLVLEGGKNVL